MDFIKIRILIILFAIIFLASCSREKVKEQHERYLANKGWEINDVIEVKTYILEIPEEMLRNYDASGITFLRDHLGEEVTEYFYKLKEQDVQGNHVKAVVFELENEIIGGYGLLPSWSPGRFNLDEKERLVNEEMVKQ